MLEPACTERRYVITERDLPLSCPQKYQAVWDAHPRVYLPIEKRGSVTCPYCGAHYLLKDFNPEDAKTVAGQILQEGGEK